MSKENVKHPDHYCYSKFEPKDVIREWGLNFNLGSAVKYLSRAGRKDDILQDLKKAQQFIQFEIEAIEAEREKQKPFIGGDDLMDAMMYAMCEDKECICKDCRYAPCTICRENEYPENIIQCAILKGVKVCWRHKEVIKE